MNRFAWMLAALLLLAAPLAAEVKISRKHQVPNHGLEVSDKGVCVGTCMWSTCETVARHYGYDNLNGLSELHKWDGQGATFEDARREIARYGIDGLMLAQLGDVRTLVRAGEPVIVGTRRDSYFGPHVLVVLDVTDTHVVFWDCNWPGETWRYKIADFTGEVWDGQAMMLWKAE